MACIPAPSCKKALADATAKWPKRNRLSDGICGDEAHRARKSDHNSGNAFDLTHDPTNGVDGDALVQQLVDSKDPRIKYIIWERRIWYPAANGPRPAGWSRYTGPNPHERHLHVSIKANARNILNPWPWSVATQRPTLRQGNKGADVRLLQAMLHIPVDGVFGDDTAKAVRRFQKIQGLGVDGVVGRATWKALGLK